MKDNNYIVVQGWMINQLKLKSNELMLFAIIYGFSQDNESEYTGSLNYLCKALNCSKPTILKNIKSLIDKELLIKRDVYNNGVKFCSYSTNFTGGKETLPGVKKLNKGGKETLLGGGKETLPNNTITNNTNINNRIKKFEISLIPFLDNYKKEMIREFADYWCEHSPGDKKLRWEKEKPFGLKRRLSTWHNSKFNTYKNTIKSEEINLKEITQNMLKKVKRDI